MVSSKLYENIVIGNFLYGLGFAVRAKQKTSVIASAVHLLQQTPSDRFLGDLLLEFPGIVRLIEFKTEANRSNKEESRHIVLSKALEGQPALERVSRIVHWYVETAPSDQGMTACIVPYLDAFPKQEKLDEFATFIEKMAIDAVEGDSTVTKDDARSYLNLVRLTLGDGAVGTGGLFLVAAKDGTLHYAPLRDLIEFRMKHRLWVQMHEKNVMHVLERQRQHNIKLRLDRGISR